MLLDHSALDRGALSTYGRLIGRRALQPWMTGACVRERAREMEAQDVLESGAHESADDLSQAAE